MSGRDRRVSEDLYRLVVVRERFEMVGCPTGYQLMLGLCSAISRAVQESPSAEYVRVQLESFALLAHQNCPLI